MQLSPSLDTVALDQDSPPRSDSPPVLAISSPDPAMLEHLTLEPESDNSEHSKSQAIPIRALSRQRCGRSSVTSLASSYGTSLVSSAPCDFPMNGHGTLKHPEGKALHASSPDMYMHNIADVGLQLVDYRDLSENLAPFYSGMVEEVCFLATCS
jgi:hypothetical protein